ncbi:MAG TPA: DNA repair protein RecO [Verrucomicrobiae bacterium]|jgi:DNA repair protein RecO (recombination protein O)|nr:DNA repair protein RecO [Verrucomicrobiae bacterium]
MAIQKTEALILKTQPFRSSSLIVTLYSRHFGKMKGIAKGVRKEREMRGAVYELFTHVDVVFYEKTRTDLHLISEASIIESFDVLRSRLDTIAYASYLTELVDSLTEIQDPHEPVFSLLEVAFRYLPAISPERIARLFEIKLLTETGWSPYLQGCLQCHVVPASPWFFSVSQGALLCGSCARSQKDARPITPETLSLLRQYVGRDLEEGIKLRPAPSAQEELRKLMEDFLHYRLIAPLKTRHFLDSVKPVLN